MSSLVTSDKTVKKGDKFPNRTWATFANSTAKEDQRKYLKTQYTSNYTLLMSSSYTKGELTIANFDSQVYYLNATSASKIPIAHFTSKLFLKHKTNGKYYKIIPYTFSSGYKFKYFWKISNTANTQILFVMLSTTSTGKYINNDDPNISTSATRINLLTFTIA